MTYEKLVRKIHTAGAEFVGIFLEEILRNYPHFANDKDKKKEFLKYMHDEYGKSIGWTFDTTKTKCYAVINIISEGRVLDAIEYVLNTDRRVPEYAKDNAAFLLDDIVRDKIKLPNE